MNWKSFGWWLFFGGCLIMMAAAVAGGTVDETVRLQIGRAPWFLSGIVVLFTTTVMGLVLMILTEKKE